MNNLLNEYLSEIELGEPQMKVTNLAEALLLLVDGEVDSGCRGHVPSPGQARGLAGWKRACWPLRQVKTSMKTTKTLLGILSITAALAVHVQAQPTFLTNGLVAYYPFNGNANDKSGYGNNGTVYGATLTADRLGVQGKAMAFNGVNQ